MKKSVMKKWVKALRSGEYIQGKGRLVDRQDRFCCLGVLCNIAPDKTGYWETVGSKFFWAFRDSINDFLDDGGLTPSVMDWSGLRSSNGRHIGWAPYPTLDEMNDRGDDFNKIADYIEKNWEEL